MRPATAAAGGRARLAEPVHRNVLEAETERGGTGRDRVLELLRVRERVAAGELRIGDHRAHVQTLRPPGVVDVGDAFAVVPEDVLVDDRP
ncbi:hypothetical protein [Streptomyces sp. NPDC005096]|uniref:hypothetical protein n=1 Tax=Streptomyces sp. NPDC005096 TaxID=3154559 RepID=UPI0033B59344